MMRMLRVLLSGLLLCVGLFGGCSSDGGGDEVIVTREDAGRPLTYTEMDSNWTYLSEQQGINVSDRGAVSGEDSTTEIQAAITAASGGTVIFPSGSWVISAPIIIPENTTVLFMQGASLSATVGFSGDSLIKITTDNVSIINPVLDVANVPRLNAAYDGSQDPRGMGIYFLGTSGTHISYGKIIGGTISNAPFVGILIKYADDVTTEGITLTNCGYETSDLSPGAIYYVFSARPTSKFNKIYSPGLKGIVAGTGGDDAVFMGNYVENGQTTGFAAYMVSNSKGWRCIGNKSKGIFGIKFDGGSTENTDFIIADNVIEDADNGGIIVQGGANGIVTNNTINGWSKSDHEAGIEIFGDPNLPQSVGPVLVVGNTLTFTGTAVSGDNGISIYSASAYGPATDIIIKNNLIYGAYNGIFTRTGTGASFVRLTVIGNTIKNTTYDGIGLQGQGLTVEQNNIISAGNNGIYITGTSGETASEYINVNNNNILSPTAYGIYIHSAAVALGVNIFNNTVVATNIGIIFYLSNIPTIWIKNNNISGTTGSTSLSLQAKASTTHTVDISENITSKTIGWTVGSGAFIGLCRWNKTGTAITTTPANVIIQTSGLGSPQSNITAPVGSVYYMSDGGANTTMWVKESYTNSLGWVNK